MPRKPSTKQPAYTLHKASGRAVVRLDGEDFYLGAHGTPESVAKYDRLISIWLANGRKIPPDVKAREKGTGTQPAPAVVALPSAPLPGPARPTEVLPDLTITELCVRYVRWAETYYRHGDGTPTGEIVYVKEALKPLRHLFGSADAAKFKAGDLRALQAHLIAGNRLCRGTINGRVSRVKRMFKWAASHDLVPVEVHIAISTVPGLAAGRTEAREADKVVKRGPASPPARTSMGKGA